MNNKQNILQFKSRIPRHNKRDNKQNQTKVQKKKNKTL